METPKLSQVLLLEEAGVFRANAQLVVGFILSRRIYSLPDADEERLRGTGPIPHFSGNDRG
jgi:hypothetical protein